MKTKTCKICGEEKPLDAFSPHRDGKQGRHPYCRRCRAKRNAPQSAEWRSRNRERYNACRRERRRKKLAAEGHTVKPYKTSVIGYVQPPKETT